MNAVYAGLCALIGNIVIYASIAFVNAQLLTATIKYAYEQTNTLARLIVVSLTLLPLANYLFSLIYRFVDPATAGMLILVSLILVLVTKSILLGMGSLTPRMALAVVVLVAAAIWVSYELHVKTA